MASFIVVPTGSSTSEYDPSGFRAGYGPITSAVTAATLSISGLACVRQPVTWFTTLYSPCATGPNWFFQRLLDGVVERLVAFFFCALLPDFAGLLVECHVIDSRPTRADHSRPAIAELALFQSLRPCRPVGVVNSTASLSPPLGTDTKMPDSTEWQKGRPMADRLRQKLASA